MYYYFYHLFITVLFIHYYIISLLHCYIIYLLLYCLPEFFTPLHGVKDSALTTLSCDAFGTPNLKSGVLKKEEIWQRKIKLQKFQAYGVLDALAMYNEKVTIRKKKAIEEIG